jgi:hypothetical protein
MNDTTPTPDFTPEPITHDAVPTETPPTVRETAKVTVKKAVDGTKRRKARSDKGKARTSVELNHVVVDPRVMAAARAAMKPGQRLVIVDAECVRLVNS